MKKSLLALAVLGAFAGVASAQSSVTIYGVLDQSVAKRNDCNPCAINPGAPGNTAWTLQQSTTSRLGFRGNEDMGGGLSAQFVIEHRFNPDTGAQNGGASPNNPAGSIGPFWNGRSFVQLTSKAAGSVYLGRDYTPAFWVQLKSDPFGNDGVGQTGVGINYAGYFTPDRASNTTSSPQRPWPLDGSARSSNTVGYKTPNLGGFTANLAVSLDEGTGQGRSQGLNAEYTAGPIYAGLGYEKVTDGTSDGRGLVNVAFHYNLGFVKPMVYFAKSKVGAGGNLSNKVVLLSASAPIGSGALKFGVSRITLDLPSTAVEDTHTKVGLGYNHFLSKRTNLYFDVGSANGAASGTGVKGERSTAYALGVRHTF